ncbi:MAG TPA: hypothetical protein VJB66_01855 [Candidatus Nanoarchaeia archaeon]|nr:hypothetical protein [Candidatus Nanoarchaeia archaeon]
MKHFTKIKPGALKTQKPVPCQECNGPVDRSKDFFILEANWKIKRKADKLSFCNLKCVSKWANS